jgi:16S rRNA (cytidine1402-2'-O)-methyltransferase
MPEPSTGTLFLVATPIGNLEDITLRALRVLREVRVIAAEDTRRTAKLLHHYDIRTPTTSLHEHNEERKLATLIERLRAGESVALVSDAGTPVVSDPGFRLVRAAVAAGLRVEPVPGASAVLAAIVASGLPTDAFVFLGCPPPRAGERRTWFVNLREDRRTLVLFESPHRIRSTLSIALETLGNRQACIGRELTKVHEDFVRGPISELIDGLDTPRGEFTLVVAGGTDASGNGCGEVGSLPDDGELWSEFCLMTNLCPSRRSAIAALARKYRVAGRLVYQALERGRES